MILHPLGQAVWEHIWKHTVEKNQTNATNATLLLFRQAIWEGIWKHTVGKSQINATNATMHLLMQARWEYIWKCTVEKSQRNATNVTLPLIVQTIWGDIWKRTLEKSNKIQPMWLCLFPDKPFEEGVKLYLYHKYWLKCIILSSSKCWDNKTNINYIFSVQIPAVLEVQIKKSLIFLRSFFLKKTCNTNKKQSSIWRKYLDIQSFWSDPESRWNLKPGDCKVSPFPAKFWISQRICLA